MLKEHDADTVIVGAGFAGLLSLHDNLAHGRTVIAIEVGADVGGTWYWNRYPGARCDLNSLEYSYSFDAELEQQWDWPERFSSAGSIQAYARHVAERHGLLEHIWFGTRVVSAVFDDKAARWTITTDDGRTVSARYCIMATGMLSTPILPDIAGIESFGGQLLHTGNWPDGVSLKGKRVAVIGTGSTGIQIVPELADQAEHLFVFQRTPSYAVPSRNAPLTEEEAKAIKAEYAAFRERCIANAGAIHASVHKTYRSGHEFSDQQREAIYEASWQEGGVHFVTLFADINVDEQIADTAGEFVRRKIRSIVKDPDTAEQLCPYYPIGSRRICLEDGYYEAFNRPDVTLVDVSEQPIAAIDKNGIAREGDRFDVDAIVFATGFDAMTGTVRRIDVRGRGGLALRDAWEECPSTYFGMITAGFPNLFFFEGPFSPGATANALRQIEMNMSWISACMEKMEELGATTVEVPTALQDAWVEEASALVAMTLYTRSPSWYWGTNVPGKPRRFLSYIDWIEYCRRVNASRASGFAELLFSGAADRRLVRYGRPA